MPDCVKFFLYIEKYSIKLALAIEDLNYVYVIDRNKRSLCISRTCCFEIPAGTWTTGGAKKSIIYTPINDARNSDTVLSSEEIGRWRGSNQHFQKPESVYVVEFSSCLNKVVRGGVNLGKHTPIGIEVLAVTITTF